MSKKNQECTCFSLEKDGNKEWKNYGRFILIAKFERREQGKFEATRKVAINFYLKIFILRFTYECIDCK